jgi:hypothetical protein
VEHGCEVIVTPIISSDLICFVLFYQISTLIAPEQGFVLATDISPKICFLEADGVAGLGRPQSGRAAFNLPTVLETFVNLGEIKGLFAIYHSR